MNHTAVTPPSEPEQLVSTHADEARHFADEAETNDAALRNLYADGRRDSARIAEVHQSLRTSLKLAEVNALLAIADEVRRLREAVAEQHHSRTGEWLTGVPAGDPHR